MYQIAQDSSYPLSCVALALAVVVTLVLGRPAGPDWPELPAYEIQINPASRGAIQSWQPTASDAMRLGPGDDLEIHLRPTRPTGLPVAIRAYVTSDDGTMRRWPGAPVRRLDGTIVLRTAHYELRSLTPGQSSFDILIALARPGQLPEGPDAWHRPAGDARYLRASVFVGERN